MGDEQNRKAVEDVVLTFDDLVKQAGDFRASGRVKTAGTDDAGVSSAHPSAAEQSANTMTAPEGAYSAEKQQDVNAEQGEMTSSKPQPKPDELTDLEKRDPPAAATGEQPEVERDLDTKGQDSGTSHAARADKHTQPERSRRHGVQRRHSRQIPA